MRKSFKECEIRLLDGIKLTNLNCNYLYQNPHQGVIDLIKKYPYRINCYLSLNSHPEAIKILKENQNKIDWKVLSGNSNPEAIKILKENFNKIDWYELSCNLSSKAIELLKENPDKICFGGLSMNSHPEAIKILKRNPKKINWYCLSINSHPEAIKILKRNSRKINWNLLSKNPSIFYEEYEEISKEYFKKHITEEIMIKIWHPKNMHKFSDWGIELN